MCLAFNAVLFIQVQGPIALVIFLFSIYIHKKINAGAGGTLTRAKTACNIFLYDPGAFLFLLFLLFAFVWFILGYVWQGGCSPAVKQVCLNVFFLFSFVVFIFRETNSLDKIN